MATVTPLRRIEFSSSDPSEAGEFLFRVRGGRLLLDGVRDRAWRLSLAQVDTGQFSSSEIRLPADLTFQMHGRDEVVISTIMGGVIGINHGKASRRYQPGDVYVASYPRADFSCHTHEIRSRTTTLPQSLLTEVANFTPDRPAGSWEFLPFPPATRGSRQWRDVTRYIDSLLADPAAASAPLVLGSAARLLAATAMTVFPNTLVTEPTAGDRRDARPATLQRAVSFIEANADIDITVADIARAAGVTARAVQLAFRRHLDITPAGYLRRIRLDQAHRQLQAADPDCDSVTAVAYRWGFSSPSRFAAYYRRSYGVRPSHTLRN
jgi:AraC-like DNA-binding protein